MELEHIVPEARGGSTEEANLWLACSPCNSHKADRTTALDPLSGQRVDLFDPRRQKWVDHFTWVDGSSRIFGLTATGRATIEALKLNRAPLVRARRRWASVGWHPPND